MGAMNDALGGFPLRLEATPCCPRSSGANPPLHHGFPRGPPNLQHTGFAPMALTPFDAIKQSFTEHFVHPANEVFTSVTIHHHLQEPGESMVHSSPHSVRL